jgi:hypothetical protein
MPKVYFCRQFRDGDACGETDPAQFSPGRYTACKFCRNNIARKAMADKKIKNKDENANHLDPDQNIRYLIEDTILRMPILEKRTVKDAIDDIDQTNSDNMIAISELNDTLKELVERVKRIESRLITLENKNLV